MILRALVAALSVVAAAQDAPVSPPAPGTIGAAETFAEVATRFADALERFRNGDDEARDEVETAARTLAAEHGRRSAPRVAQAFAALEREQRIAGARWEARVDALRSRLHAIDRDRAGTPSWDPTEERLRALYDETRDLADPVPAARAAALLARLAIRRAERDERGSDDAAAAARAFAEDARARFAGIGYELPQLEPLWVIARTSLVAGDFRSAGDAFYEMEGIARESGRAAWRERALVGLIGVARERGDTFAVDDFLEELARFRDPERCWVLAREYAIQRLGEDDAEAALRWLEAHPPATDDLEIVPSDALEEWDALRAAAILRAGRGAGDSAAREEHVRPGAGVALNEVEALVEQGRALLDAGRARSAVAPLERALAITRERERSLALDTMTFGSASPVGEWLGLTAVEALARAHVDLDAPLEAAVVIEAAHAGLTQADTRERVLERASAEDLGLVTWVVGADSSLAVHVSRDGDAAAWRVPHGRAALGRAIERARSEILRTRVSSGAVEDGPLAQLARVVLPPPFRNERFVADEGTSVVFLPHGVLERLPFEALPTADGPELGLVLALSVETDLRDPDTLAPRADFKHVEWTVLGAPDASAFDDLPDAEQELDALGAIHPRVSTERGDRFDESALRAALGGSRPVHIATHVAREPECGPASHGLVVSGNRIVTAREIARMEPRLPLIVLAACASADGRAVDGLGVRGVAQATLASGTRAAVVTLWPITDGSAGRASLVLHGALMAGARPAEALRRARVLLWRLGEPPAEWAAHRLLGRS